MAATFNWSIADCERVMSTGGITVAHWRCNATETVGSGDDAVTHEVGTYGAQSLSPNPSSSDFVAYDSVTEAQVKDWIWEANVDKDAVQAQLQAQIDDLKSPTTGTGVPW